MESADESVWNLMETWEILSLSDLHGQAAYIDGHCSAETDTSGSIWAVHADARNKASNDETM